MINGAAGGLPADDTTPSTLSFLDPLGNRYEWVVRSGAAGDERTHGRMARLVQVTGGATFVQHWIPVAPNGSAAAALDALENEVRAGVRLARRYAQRYPPELVRLIGYDIDCPEPFVLLAQRRGGPCTVVAGELGVTALHAFQASLFRGLLLLAEASIVHDDLSPDAVSWDGTFAQIGGFSSATLVRERRPRRATSAWASPQRRAAASPALPADDIWSAGLVVFQVATGREPLPGPPDLSSRGEALRNLLTDVFSPEPEGRPSAPVLLRRLGVSDQPPAGQLDDLQAFAEGRREFDRLLREKWDATVPADTAPDRHTSAERRGRRLPTSQRALLVLTAVLLTVLVVIAARTALGGSW